MWALVVDQGKEAAFPSSASVLGSTSRGQGQPRDGSEIIKAEEALTYHDGTAYLFFPLLAPSSLCSIKNYLPLRPMKRHAGSPKLD